MGKTLLDCGKAAGAVGPVAWVLPCGGRGNLRVPLRRVHRGTAYEARGICIRRRAWETKSPPVPGGALLGCGGCWLLPAPDTGRCRVLFALSSARCLFWRRNPDQGISDRAWDRQEPTACLMHRAFWRPLLPLLLLLLLLPRGVLLDPWGATGFCCSCHCLGFSPCFFLSWDQPSTLGIKMTLWLARVILWGVVILISRFLLLLAPIFLSFYLLFLLLFPVFVFPSLSA